MTCDDHWGHVRQNLTPTVHLLPAAPANFGAFVDDIHMNICYEVVSMLCSEIVTLERSITSHVFRVLTLFRVISCADFDFDAHLSQIREEMR